ncbi:MAG TPA: hypothetical protein PLM04_00975 [Paludibacteraceae bacterium]|nr:hypothetical protein [Paludibacteraceae bacterium]HRT77771.1 hypothetical protein [Paludibacteraceae bacterium]
MKTKILGLAALLLFATQTPAQSTFTVEARNYDISDNLDLRAVASIFAESRDLSDFEMRLNDARYQISNLDLNNDGWIDYLRVVETSGGNLHLVVIQAVLDRYTYQDVASIVVEKRNSPQVYVQIIGDPYLFGVNYVIEPIFVRQPVIFSFFWSKNYRPWHSPYYWGHYPKYYRPLRPVEVNIYLGHVHHIIPRDYKFHYHNSVNIYYRDAYVRLHQTVRRNDFERTHPERGFNSRNKNVANKAELNNSSRRSSTEQERRIVNQDNGSRRISTSSSDSRYNNSENNSSRRSQNTGRVETQNNARSISNTGRSVETRTSSQNEKNSSRTETLRRSENSTVNTSQRTSENNSRGTRSTNSNSENRSGRR